MGFFQRLFDRSDDPSRRPRVRIGLFGSDDTGYNCTERTAEVLALARDEAVALGHEYVGTEHMLLALVREGEGVGVAVIRELAGGTEPVRGQLLAIVQPDAAPPPTGPDLPYTSRAKKALELAMAEARVLHHSYVGTEHLLLGLAAERGGVAAQVLAVSGVTLDAARRETLRLLGSPPPEPPAAA